uniref:Cytochrome c oxidase subunit 3 n=1 Tax=Pratylenchus vulnus TaxID=45931 RepID=M1E1P9_PRAVU|nr:cytochrome c oxidase subunit III [Pratylenchus vulnus]
MKNYPRSFFCVTGSFYPIMTSSVLSSLFSSILVFLKQGILLSFFMSLLNLLFVVYCWLNNVLSEGKSGSHSFLMQSGFKMVFWYILLSEVMFFFGMFWFLLDISLVPSSELGEIWPPMGVEVIDPFGVPLFNSMILLTSAVALSRAQKLHVVGLSPVLWLSLTIFLGWSFLLVQFFEYYTSSFTFSDSSYGSIFYMLTGFHGLHVFFGVLFLSSVFYRFLKSQMSSKHALTFEFSIIYWHFVDFVWLLVFLLVMYWSE